MNKSVLKLTTCASFFVLLTACGGSDDSNTSGKKPTITKDNLEEVVESTFQPLITLPYVIAKAFESSFDVLPNIEADPDAKEGMLMANCDAAGKVDIVLSMKDMESGNLSNNDSISMTFDNCTDILQGKINGSLDLVFTDVGETKNGLDSIGIDKFPEIKINFDNFKIDYGSSLSTAHGEISMSQTGSNGSESSSLKSESFSVGDEDGTATIKGLEMLTSTIGNIESISLNASSVMNSKQSNTSYTITTTVPFESSPDTDFTKGTVVFASAPSKLTITFNSESKAHAKLDSDGDGVDDYTVGL